MGEIDFPTALARLLRDGSLRDAFAANPALIASELGVNETDFQALVGLSPPDLEVQANVLLRKRYDEIKRILPVTLGRLGELAWQTFRAYARSQWPPETPMALSDAMAFCDFLRAHNPEALCRTEANRVFFAASKRLFSLFLVPDVPRRQRMHFGIQLLLRSGKFGCRELAICFCP